MPLLLRLLLRNMSLDGRTGALGIRRTSFFEQTLGLRFGSVYLENVVPRDYGVRRGRVVNRR